jgi:putative acetyltransferase
LSRNQSTTITIEPPRQSEVLDLLRQSDEYAFALYPADSCYLLNIDDLEAPTVSVFVARPGDVAGSAAPAATSAAPAAPAGPAAPAAPAVGIAALALRADSTAELKRVFVAPSARGRGVARDILRAVEDFARSQGVSAIRLETGVAQPEAIALYEKVGYHHIPRFGQYVDDETSVCMEKPLG